MAQPYRPGERSGALAGHSLAFEPVRAHEELRGLQARLERRHATAGVNRRQAAPVVQSGVEHGEALREDRVNLRAAPPACPLAPLIGERLRSLPGGRRRCRGNGRRRRRWGWRRPRSVRLGRRIGARVRRRRGPGRRRCGTWHRRAFLHDMGRGRWDWQEVDLDGQPVLRVPVVPTADTYDEQHENEPATSVSTGRTPARTDGGSRATSATPT